MPFAARLRRLARNEVGQMLVRASGIPFDPSATLWVDAATGDDNRSKATVAASGGLLPWATPGRAIWGSTNRSSPNPSEAAGSGDIVDVYGSLSYGSPVVYSTSVAVNDEGIPVYLPANNGITLRARGYVQLGAPNANAPLIGQDGTRADTAWIGNWANSRWILRCDGRFGTPRAIASSSAAGGVLTVHTTTAHGFTTGEMVILRDHDCTPAIGGAGVDTQTTVTVIDADTFTIANTTYTAGGGATGTVRKFFDSKADASVINTTPDSGPVSIGGSGFYFSAFEIDGGPLIDYHDNWEGLRVQNGQDFVVRNGYIHDFRKDADEDGLEDTSQNQSAVTMYGAQNGLIEHLLLENNGCGVFFKDRAFLDPSFGNTVRYLRIKSPDITDAPSTKYGITWSMTAVNGHGASTVHSCVITDMLAAFNNRAEIVGDDIYNMTVARCAYGWFGPRGAISARCWNSIVSVTTRVLHQDSVTMEDDATLDLEHNVYHGGFPMFVEDSSGNRDFNQWRTDEPTQDQAGPAGRESVAADPLFVDPVTDNFRLQLGSPARDRGIDIGDLDGDGSIADTCHAGAYQTMAETIGPGGA